MPRLRTTTTEAADDSVAFSEDTASAFSVRSMPILHSSARMPMRRNAWSRRAANTRKYRREPRLTCICATMSDGVGQDASPETRRATEKDCSPSRLEIKKRSEENTSELQSL